MPRGRPVAPMSLDVEEKNQLLSVARSRSLSHGVVQRAQIVLACAEGESNAVAPERRRCQPSGHGAGAGHQPPGGHQVGAPLPRGGARGSGRRQGAPSSPVLEATHQSIADRAMGL